MTELHLTQRQYLEFEKLSIGALAPLDGFMNRDVFDSVVRKMRLRDGTPFTLPVVLDLDARQTSEVRSGSADVALVYQGREVGSIERGDVFECDKVTVARHVYGTDDPEHPGVAHFYRMGSAFLGGVVRARRDVPLVFEAAELTPAETRRHFEEAGWKSVAGFQTRNVPHRAHEYLQRLALEQCDGLFIQPLVGAKKRGDYRPEAVVESYRVLVRDFLPSSRVLFGVLSTSMRYAGPREAVFHAIIRRNYGCTHFVVGRDHAGVGTYYGKYDAHELTREFDGELGINILRFHGPFYCRRCDGIVTERTCNHRDTDPAVVSEVSGSAIRAMLTAGAPIDSTIFRPEIARSIAHMDPFISEDAL